MSEPRMSTAICHLLLAGSSAWTCRTLYNAGHIQWAYGTLGLYFAKSVVGVLRYGVSQHSARLDDAYNTINFLCKLLCFNCFASDLYYTSAVNQNTITYMPYLHLLLGFVPAMLKLIDQSYVRLHIIVLIDTACMISVTYIGSLTGNKFAIGTTFVYYIICITEIYFQHVSQICVHTVELVVLEIFMACSLTNRNMFREIIGG